MKKDVFLGIIAIAVICLLSSCAGISKIDEPLPVTRVLGSEPKANESLIVISLLKYQGSGNAPGIDKVNYNIFLNDDVIGSIIPGETKQFAIPNGNYKLKLEGTFNFFMMGATIPYIYNGETEVSARSRRIMYECSLFYNDRDGSIRFLKRADDPLN
jgi:hypothetical protein